MGLFLNYCKRVDERANEHELEKSSTDIFTSALASAGINMETTVPFNNEGDYYLI
jgi:hypothetical protein